MKSIAQLIADATAVKLAAVDGMTDLHTEMAGNPDAAGSPLVQKAFTDLSTVADGANAQLAHLTAQEKAIGQRSTPIGDARYPHVSSKSNLPKGTAFVRYATALALSKGNLHAAAEMAGKYRDTPEVANVLKAAVAAGTTTDPAWAAPLVEYQAMSSEFIALLKPLTIVGRMEGFRRVPFNIKVPRQTASGSVGWVGESKPKPVSQLAFDQVQLPFAKIAGIVVISKELARFSSPSAEALIRDDMVSTIAAFMDQAFIDPAAAAVAGVSPGSVTNDVVPIDGSGADTGDEMRALLTSALLQMADANLSFTGVVWVMPPSVAMRLADLRNTLGAVEFAGMQNMAAPVLSGLPVIVSTAARPGTIILASAPEIMLADDGDVTIDVSTEAAVSMTSDGAGTTLTSLWQSNLIGILAERMAYWLKRNAKAVVVITGVSL